MEQQVSAAAPQPASLWANDELTSLYEAHARRVRLVCRRTLDDGNDVDDAVQLTFLKAYRSLLRGAGPRDPEAWLSTIARNVCRSGVRDRLLVPVSELNADDVPEAAAPGEEVDRRERFHAVISAVGELPRRERAAVLLQAFEGVSNAEAAVRLGTTESGVESLLVRARSQMRARLRSVPARSFGFAGPWLRSLLPLQGRGAGLAQMAASVALGGAVVALGPAAHAVPAGPMARSATAPKVAHPVTPRDASAGSASPREARVGARTLASRHRAYAARLGADPQARQPALVTSHRVVVASPPAAGSASPAVGSASPAVVPRTTVGSAAPVTSTPAPSEPSTVSAHATDATDTTDAASVAVPAAGPATVTAGVSGDGSVDASVSASVPAVAPVTVPAPAAVDATATLGIGRH